MKEYLLFAGNNYYPGGGMDDYIGAYTDIEEAMQEANRKEGILGNKRNVYDWWHIANRTTMEVVVHS